MVEKSQDLFLRSKLKNYVVYKCEWNTQIFLKTWTLQLQLWIVKYWYFGSWNTKLPYALDVIVKGNFIGLKWSVYVYPKGLLKIDYSSSSSAHCEMWEATPHRWKPALSLLFPSLLNWKQQSAKIKFQTSRSSIWWVSKLDYKTVF